MSNIKELSKKYEGQILEFFKDLHMHPELSFKEFRTTQKIKDLLTPLGIEIIDMRIETGVVGNMMDLQ
ncbi:hypothetical protein [Intestinibacter bartlettii]|uniref:hypothetical protein n=1 Tax=Intestinibacter bartlettii TaxID=261299 RepID=UPI00321A51A5